MNLNDSSEAEANQSMHAWMDERKGPRRDICMYTTYLFIYLFIDHSHSYNNSLNTTELE